MFRRVIVLVVFSTVMFGVYCSDYFFGIDTKKNYETARNCFENQYEKRGYPDVIYILMLINGDGGEQNLETARRLVDELIEHEKFEYCTSKSLKEEIQKRLDHPDSNFARTK